MLLWDQREGGAGAAGDADHLAAIDDVAAIIVRGQLDRLADADIPELAFLEIGVDIGGADRNDHTDRRARGGALADLQPPAGGEDAAPREEQGRVGTGRGSTCNYWWEPHR